MTVLRCLEMGIHGFLIFAGFCLAAGGCFALAAFAVNLWAWLAGQEDGSDE